MSIIPRLALTTTSYAILGLLWLRPWTTYELAKQMERSMRHLWPRAESKLYEEPKKLVAAGLASVERQFTGRRPRALYSITPAGREALAAWIAQPGNLDPTVEYEAMLRVLFADTTSTEILLDLLQGMRGQAEHWTAWNRERIEEFLGAGGPFPDRLHVIALVARFIWDYRAMVESWARWAEAEVETWPAMDQVDARSVIERALRPLLVPDHARD